MLFGILWHPNQKVWFIPIYSIGIFYMIYSTLGGSQFIHFGWWCIVHSVIMWYTCYHVVQYERVSGQTKCDTQGWESSTNGQFIDTLLVHCTTTTLSVCLCCSKRHRVLLVHFLHHIPTSTPYSKIARDPTLNSFHLLGVKGHRMGCGFSHGGEVRTIKILPGLTRFKQKGVTSQWHVVLQSKISCEANILNDITEDDIIFIGIYT